MIKILLLTIIILFLSCQHNQEFRMEGDLKNQSEINFIKNNCQKYNSQINYLSASSNPRLHFIV